MHKEQVLLFGVHQTRPWGEGDGAASGPDHPESLCGQAAQPAVHPVPQEYMVQYGQLQIEATDVQGEHVRID